MKIAVLLKWVPDLVEELEVDDDGIGIDTDDLKFKLNEFDDHALEEALQIANDGDEVVAIAIDGDGTEKMLYTAIAKGASSGIRLTGGSNSNTANLAAGFATALDGGNYDLILTGVQSVDDLDGQLGPILAANMGLPCVSVVSSLNVSGGVSTVTKEYSGGIVAEFEVDLPAVLGIQAARETPRYAPVSKIRQVQQSTDLAEKSVSGSSTSGTIITAMSEPETGGGAKMLDDVEDLIEILKGLGVS
ncbi:MAG: electron transfer flavoprotein subunit alpha [Euryarchaeota archaeon]|nr:electron transfer flavoprotein subunit alpha [Euryarchaeota archaeon]